MPHKWELWNFGFFKNREKLRNRSGLPGFKSHYNTIARQNDAGAVAAVRSHCVCTRCCSPNSEKPNEAINARLHQLGSEI